MVSGQSQFAWCHLKIKGSVHGRRVAVDDGIALGDGDGVSVLVLDCVGDGVVIGLTVYVAVGLGDGGGLSVV